MKQGIYEQSATPKYPVGTRLAIGDRVLHYCRTVTNVFGHWGAQNNDVLHEQNTEVIASAGDLSLTILHTTATKDQFKDGYINIHTTPMQVCLRIKGNDASDSTRTVLYLKDPLLLDTPAGTFTDVHANIYNNVGSGGIGISKPSASVICMPLINVTSGNFFWGQTWGPVVGTAHTGGGQGSGGNQRNVYFQDDGSIDIPSRVSGTTDSQHAGFLLPTTDGSDDIFFMLQLAP